MYDRRVIRGNTYALHVLPAHAQPDPIEIQKQIERRRNFIARRRMREELRPKSPLPLDGRLHQPVQTELYLEALTEQIEEADETCQTDDFLDRPPTPLYVPAKVGVDVMTQIYEGDLFDFDLEVTPVLEVLIGKTIEQSLLEIAEEEELASIRAQQNAFEEIRQADLLEVARLTERERRIHVKLSCLTDYIHPSKFYFKVANNIDIEEGFLPWLMAETDEELELWNDACLLLDGMIREVVQERHHEYRQLELMAAEMALMQEAGAALTGQSDQQELSDELTEDRKTENIIESSLDKEPGEDDEEEQNEKDDRNDEGEIQAEGEKDEPNSERNDQNGDEIDEE
ncbi:putative flagellar radial spoke protein [Schistosoma mansoni]|uniref:putative flagellar radial spoke protein n=1 Tax=Schistosoma mansoni TaxID=6183 RepID=UPI00022DC65A|nr:putative flagellar radial spoke protein [Schistosoma mansoni]|eukprot:XP_018653025.1 putative flagellar radial spoke protein [Schistosoma mansoni]